MNNFRPNSKSCGTFNSLRVEQQYPVAITVLRNIFTITLLETSGGSFLILQQIDQKTLKCWETVTLALTTAFESLSEKQIYVQKIENRCLFKYQTLNILTELHINII